MNEIEAVGEESILHATGTPDSAGPERPWIFALLIAPMAVLANGVVNVLAFLMRRQGISVARSSEIVSLLILPQTIYFLWSPLTDFFIRRRSWLMLGAAGSALLLAAAFHEHSLAQPTAITLMFLSACLGQLVVSSCGGIMAMLHGEKRRRTASSFYQAGSLAFGAVAVFVLASLAAKKSQGALGWIAAAMIGIPALAAFAAPKQMMLSGERFGHRLRQTGHEFHATFLNWRAVPYILLMLFPIGTGAAIGLLTGVAQDYHVNASQVAWMNGLAGALLMAAGSLCAPLLPTRIRSSVVYLCCALVNAALLTVLWLGPLQPSTYFVGSTLYLFTIGTCYAMTTAVILEFMGHSGQSGSGRYAIINSMANVPVSYMTALDGRGDKLWGARGVSGVEAVLGGLAAVLLLMYFLSHRPKQPAL